MRPTFAVALMLACAAGCDTLIGFPDVPPVSDGGRDASLAKHETGTPDGPARRDVTTDARGHDARADVHENDATTMSDRAVPDAPPAPDVAADVTVGFCCSCAGGEALDAGCLVTLATEAGAPISIALDTTHVYWAASGVPGTIRRAPTVPVDGGGAVTLAAAQLNPFRIAIDSQNVYWVNFGSITDAGLSTPTGGVLSASLDGGAVNVLVPDRPAAYGITVDQGTAYWTEDTLGSPVRSIPTIGGAPALFAGIPAGTGWAMSANGGDVYWTVDDSADATGSVWVAPRSTGTPRLIAAGEDRPFAIVATSDHVYWIALGAVHPTLLSLLVDGGAPATLASQDGGFPYGIAVDDQYLYWTDILAGSVMKVALAGGAPVTLATTQDAGPSGIAVDDASVYWGESKSGRVMKLTPK